MQAAPHIPVMLDAVLESFGRVSSGLIVDGTVGQGGHSGELLLRMPPSVSVVGFDRDPQAVSFSTRRLESFGPRFRAFHCGYDAAADVLESQGLGKAAAILLDLGLSSTQLGSDRGFSFSGGDEQPLDMRFDPTDGPTAVDVIRATPEKVLAEAFRVLGEVPMAGRLARILKEEAGANRMETIGQFNAVCRRIYGPRIRKVSSPTLPAQALRMMVNRELDRLEKFFADLPRLLAPGGRVAVISFHSGEDRVVKHRMRALAAGGDFALPFRKALLPAADEVAANPRARSAKLRVLDRAGA